MPLHVTDPGPASPLVPLASGAIGAAVGAILTYIVQRLLRRSERRQRRTGYLHAISSCLNVLVKIMEAARRFPEETVGDPEREMARLYSLASSIDDAEALSSNQRRELDETVGALTESVRQISRARDQLGQDARESRARITEAGRAGLEAVYACRREFGFREVLRWPQPYGHHKCSLGAVIVGSGDNQIP